MKRKKIHNRAHLTRLARNDAASKFQEDILAAMAVYENQTRSERAKRAWARRKANL